MHKQLFFLISSNLIIYSFSAETAPCTKKTDRTTCKADTTNNCEWTATQASCAAATCTGLEENPCKAIKSCAWDSNNDGSCEDAEECEELTDQTTPKCEDSGYCVWTAAVGQTPGSCAAVDCTTLTATADACTAAKGCAFTAAGGSCAKKGTSGGDGGSTGSAFGLKTSLTLLIIGFLL